MRDAVEPSLTVARRAAVIAVKAAVWLVGSLVMLVLFLAWLIANGPQLAGLLGFPLVWLALTWLLWRRPRPAPRR